MTTECVFAGYSS